MGYKIQYLRDKIDFNKDGMLRRIYAFYDGKKYGSGWIEIWRIHEDGTELTRNIYYCPIAGYLFYSLKPDTWETPIAEGKGIKDGTDFVPGNIVDTFCEKHPNFKWMLEKAIKQNPRLTNKTAWELFMAWKKWPQSERLLQGGYWKLCMSEAFRKAPYMRQKAICSWLMQHPEVKDPSFNEVTYIMKNNVTQDIYRICKSGKYKIETARYICAQAKKTNESAETTMRVYTDYIEMAKRLGHNVADAYWEKPSDLREMHNKVLEENKRIEMQRKKEEQKKYRKAIKRFINKTTEIGSIKVFVPKEYKEWETQAHALHQCICRIDYYERVAKGSTLLLFVHEKGKPMATAELDNKGKIIQFYADEGDRENMTPTKEASEAVNEWIRTFWKKQKKSAA